VQQPHPSIWIGGSNDAALRRAAAFAAVWQPTPTPVADLVERQACLRKACDQIGRQHPPETRMSFRVEFSPITGKAPPSGAERPIGHGTPAEVAALPGNCGRKRLPDQFPRQSQSWSAPRLDGLLHAGSKAASDVTKECRLTFELP
jgi:hypothetical protein